MGKLLLVVVAAIILSAIVFGAAAFTLGRDRGLTPPRPDGVPFDLPADRPLERADVEDVRFDTAVRGYRMSQVDDIMLRFADDLDYLHARIIELEDQLAERRAAEDEERPFEFPWDAESTPDLTDEAPSASSEAEEVVAAAPATAAPATPVGEAPGSEFPDTTEEQAGASGTAETAEGDDAREVAGPRSGRG